MLPRHACGFPRVGVSTGVEVAVGGIIVEVADGVGAVGVDVTENVRATTLHEMMNGMTIKKITIRIFFMFPFLKKLIIK